ncbi:hypothetical protein PR048_007322 [Dryococelus australis]|uniref:Uncharacterized protein n=1 Tax=Dryococelus australis TaxID=614101 RepID=A0ABQ9IDC0_9NEOP|nr:hypothetical protein PR048_007322 [Dryococelus australis]
MPEADASTAAELSTEERLWIRVPDADSSRAANCRQRRVYGYMCLKQMLKSSQLSTEAHLWVHVMDADGYACLKQMYQELQLKSFHIIGAVVVYLFYVNRARFPAGSLLDFHMLKSYRTMPLYGVPPSFPLNALASAAAHIAGLVDSYRLTVAKPLRMRVGVVGVGRDVAVGAKRDPLQPETASELKPLHPPSPSSRPHQPAANALHITSHRLLQPQIASHLVSEMTSSTLGETTILLRPSISRLFISQFGYSHSMRISFRGRSYRLFTVNAVLKKERAVATAGGPYSLHKEAVSRSEMTYILSPHWRIGFTGDVSCETTTVGIGRGQFIMKDCKSIPNPCSASSCWEWAKRKRVEARVAWNGEEVEEGRGHTPKFQATVPYPSTIPPPTVQHLPLDQKLPYPSTIPPHLAALTAGPETSVINSWRSVTAIPVTNSLYPPPTPNVQRVRLARICLLAAMLQLLLSRREGREALPQQALILYTCTLIRGRGGAVVRTLASHVDEPCSITGEVSTVFLHVTIMSGDAADQRVFSRISRFPRLCIPAQLHTHLT